jgi:hypothetical protein
MTATLIVDNIRNSANTVNLSTTYLRRRLVQRVYKRFHGGGNPEQGGGGLWNPGNEYRPIPGNTLSITPIYSDSILVYTCNAPVGHRQNSHSITHWKFYAGGQEYARHSKSGEHMSFAHVHRWEVPSWGAGRAGSMGYQVRQYGDGTHSTHYNGRRWLDGSDTSRSVPSYVMVEEYVPAS